MESTPDLSIITERFKTAIEDYVREDPEDRNLTRVAGLIGVHTDTLVRYMEGKSKKGPSYRDVVAIARITGKPVDWFVGEEVVA